MGKILKYLPLRALVVGYLGEETGYTEEEQTSDTLLGETEENRYPNQLSHGGWLGRGELPRPVVIHDPTIKTARQRSAGTT